MHTVKGWRQISTRLPFLPGAWTITREESGRKKFMNTPIPSVIALLYGPDQPGIVARISNWIFLPVAATFWTLTNTAISNRTSFFNVWEWMHHEDRAHVRRLADAFAKMVAGGLRHAALRIGFSDERA